MPSFPPAGTPGIFDPRNPTLLPNFNRPVASGSGTLGYQSPASFLASNPRTDATATATIGGTVTAADTITLTVTLATLPGGVQSVTYAAITGDTTETIAEALATLVNENAAFQNANIYAVLGGEAAPSAITVHANGPVGNFAVLSYTLSGSATETVTISPSNGALSGGSGPIFAANNFEWGQNGTLSAFFSGQPYLLGLDVITAMVAQGMPIV